jgi:hypothetical protein
VLLDDELDELIKGLIVLGMRQFGPLAPNSLMLNDQGSPVFSPCTIEPVIYRCKPEVIHGRERCRWQTRRWVKLPYLSIL